MLQRRRIRTVISLASAALAPATLLSGCAATALPPVTAPHGGRLVVIDDFPSRHVSARRVVVWLPPGYDTGTADYPVLYMQDGQNLFDPPRGLANAAWDIDRHLIELVAAGRVRPAIVVGIWNSGLNRAREYGPAVAINSQPAGVRDLIPGTTADGKKTTLSDQYLRFLVEELKPAIDGRFRTRHGRADTMLMGSSMGGLISLYALCTHPQVFGAAACLSTHWPISTNYPLLGPPIDARIVRVVQAWQDWLRANLPEPGAHRLYFDYGSLHLDRHYAPLQGQVDAIGAARGYRRNVDWVSRAFPGADHNEKSWNQRLHIPLTFLLAP